ncbi:MAG: uncharacterized protein K0R15_230 [Clostridiales bacterium]|jgi:stage II sporulation protein D|nr:uncharacterized protein [Clostridiales bacterium]
MKKISVLLMTICLVIPVLSGFALTQEWLRVGLKTYYENVDKINIYNKNIEIGFGKASEFVSEVGLESTTGFLAIPAPMFYCISNNNYISYEEVKLIADQFNALGIYAIPGLASQGIWKLYVGEDSNVEIVNYTLLGIEGLMGISFHLAEDNGQRIKIKGDNNELICDNSSGYIQINPSNNTLDSGGESLSPEVIDLGTRSYRGRIEIGRYRENGITAINEINMDEYLYGVVPSEIIASWPMESLKAQAVAARTYASYYLTVVDKYPNKAYDICDTTASQAYKGYKGENAYTTEAVKVTSGEMVYYNDKVIATYFSAASGGSTESIQNVWSSNAPYYKSVPDIYETEPSRQPWLITLTASKIKTICESKGIYIGDITDLVVGAYTDAGRAMSVEIIGTQGTHTLTKENIRTWFNLYSRKFTLVKVASVPKNSFQITNDGSALAEYNINDLFCLNGNGEIVPVNSTINQLIMIGGTDIANYPLVTALPGEYIFAGQGWGHGVGLSQSGAMGMAKNGFSYKQILMYYYTGTIVK